MEPWTGLFGVARFDRSSDNGNRCFYFYSSDRFSFPQYCLFAGCGILASSPSPKTDCLPFHSCSLRHCAIDRDVSPSYSNTNFKIWIFKISKIALPRLFVRLFLPFSIFCCSFSTFFVRESREVARSSVPRYLHLIGFPAPSTQQFKFMFLKNYGRYPNPGILCSSRFLNPSVDLQCSLGLPSRSFSTTSSPKPPRPQIYGGKSVRGSHLSMRKRVNKFDSHFPNSSEVGEIVEAVEKGESDMESKLNQMHPILSAVCVRKIIGMLNQRGVAALRFFNWVLKTQLDFIPNSEIYNLLIDNLGRLKDFESMSILLNELSRKRHCLTEKAFGFLAFSISSGGQIMDIVERVVEALSRVRGSCRSSGIYMLIKELCAMNCFEMATFVMEETARKTSYYNVLVKAKCRHGDFQDAHDLYDEMRRFGCDPNTKSYNYLLGSLCKNGRIAEVCELLEKMETLGYLPDSVTFEIVIVHACRLGNMDFAIEFLHRMMAEGLEPRISTHAVFIKGYYWFGRASDAYRYVVEMSGKDKHSANMNYSLLASLLHKSGRTVEAGKLLIELTEKGLKPNFLVYMRVLKDLFKLRKGDMVADLKANFSKFHPCSVIG